MQLILFIGLQASGKSTFFQRQFADTHVRINLDMLRARRRERLLFDACLSARQPAVIDNTNATQSMMRRSVAEKNELLFQHGVNFNDLPAWQKRGAGLYWEGYEKEGLNPVSGEKVLARRRRVIRDLELPMKDAYGDFIVGKFVG